MRAAALTVAFAVLPLAAQAQPIFTRDGSAGLYGTPYGYLGPSGTRQWEMYRRHHDETGTAHPSVSAIQPANLQRIIFDGLQMGADQGNPLWVAPGVFAGTRHATDSYPPSDVLLVEHLFQGRRDPIDVRVGFAEHLAAGDGGSFGSFVINNGGENADMDLWNGNWGVDGLETNFRLMNDGGTWRLQRGVTSLVSATSPYEVDRPNRVGEVAFIGFTDGGAGLLATAISTSTPLSMRWFIARAGARTSLEVELGGDGGARLSWAFDDGAGRRGLTDPGPDAGYQNGALDLTRVVPVMYLGRGGTVAGAVQPTGTLEIGLAPVDAGGAGGGAQPGGAQQYDVACGCAGGPGLPAALLLLAALARRKRRSRVFLIANQRF